MSGPMRHASLEASTTVNMAYRDTLRHDLYRYKGRLSAGAFLHAYFRKRAFKYTFWLRTAAHLRSHRSLLSKPVYLIAKLMLDVCSVRYGYQILDDTQIGPGLYLGHFGTIIVNPEAVIGRNVNIAVGVTIGQANRGRRAGSPTIGDRVWVGTNAIIVGRVTIGDGALIAPGAYVNFDVPPNAVVLGNPGKIVADTGTAGYVENTLD